MRKTMWAVTAAALLVATISPAHVMAESESAAKPKTKVASPAKPKLSGEMARIAKSSNLTPEQMQKIESLSAEYSEAMRKWYADNKEALAKAKADATGEDEEAKKSAAEASKKIASERKALESEFARKAMAVLTPEQRASLEAEKTASGVNSRLSKSNISLTEAQKSQIKSIVEDVYKNVDTSDAAAMKKANAAVGARVNSEVLTEDQRAQLPKAAAKAGKTADKHADKAKQADKAKPKAE